LFTLILIAALPWRASSQNTPRDDFHQHLLSPAVAKLIGVPHPFVARDLIAEMNAAGIKHALILSLAYQFGNPNRPPVSREYESVRAENDWTAEQVKAYPDRLRAACGVDPLRSYALTEIERCSRNSYLKHALKLHFGNSDVDLDNPEHVARLRRVFHLADKRGMAIIVHMHANVSHHRAYGHHEAEIFLNQIIPSAPHSLIQIAHLAGSGGYDDPETDAALQVFIDAVAHHDPRMTHVYFDISGVAGLGNWEAQKEKIAARIRALGVQRILFGSDGAWTGFTPEKAISAYGQLPLTPDEFRIINSNTTSYLAF